MPLIVIMIIIIIESIPHTEIFLYLNREKESGWVGTDHFIASYKPQLAL